MTLENYLVKNRKGKYFRVNYVTVFECKLNLFIKVNFTQINSLAIETEKISC